MPRVRDRRNYHSGASGQANRAQEGDNGRVLCGACPVARVDTVSLPGRVRVLRTALLVVWVGFLPVWLVALKVGAQPTVSLVAVSFAVWMALWVAGHRALRRERCPVCGGVLFAGEVFESLRSTACASCHREFRKRADPDPG
jgi:Flp pilus assembly protein TadB